ncbi:MAG: DUF2461 domain-containing protein [Alistipes sp.]
MKELIEFFTALSLHNEKSWFDAHRAEYNRVRSSFQTFVEGLIDGISSFDPSINGLKVSDCTFRINRDLRFSADKSPYKTHTGAYIAPHGKKADYAGYYFHIEPTAEGTMWRSQLSAGLYMPDSILLHSVRDEIFDNGTEVMQAIGEAEGFVLNDENVLKRTPKGYPPESEFDGLLRHKDFFLQRSISTDFLLDPQLLEHTISEFRKTKHFIDLLNRAVQYAHEEMM